MADTPLKLEIKDLSPIELVQRIFDISREKYVKNLPPYLRDAGELADVEMVNNLLKDVDERMVISMIENIGVGLRKEIQSHIVSTLLEDDKDGQLRKFISMLMSLPNEK